MKTNEFEKVVDMKEQESILNKIINDKEKSRNEFAKEEKVKQIREKLLEASGPGTYERYLLDITKYLGEKFPDEDYSRILEAAGYISQRTNVVVQDLLNERDKMWNVSMRKMQDRYERELRKGLRVSRRKE